MHADYRYTIARDERAPNFPTLHSEHARRNQVREAGDCATRECTPCHIYDGYRERPRGHRREIGEVVGAVRYKTEEEPGEHCACERPSDERRMDDEEYKPRRIEHIERDNRPPNRISGEERAELGLIEALGECAYPGEVEDAEQDERGEVEIDGLHI